MSICKHIYVDVNQGNTMRQIETSPEKIKAFVASLHANGKKPCERFGMSWDALSELEKKVPELTCKTLHNGSQTA